MSGGATAFDSTADPAAYVPYAGAERALAALEEWAGDPERRVCVLQGAEGAGKSMLLAVLAARVGRHAVPVAVSADGLDPETLARTLLDALGAPWEGSPRVALVRAVERPGVRRLLLLVDDADALAPRTEMWLFDFVRRSAGAVRALLAVRDPRLATELAAAFQSGTSVFTLDAALSREEAEAWLRAELARGSVDDGQRARFDALAVERLHSRSGGVPGRLRQEAAALLAAAPAPGKDAAAAPPESAPPATAPAAVPSAPAPSSREPAALPSRSSRPPAPSLPLPSQASAPAALAASRAPAPAPTAPAREPEARPVAARPAEPPPVRIALPSRPLPPALPGASGRSGDGSPSTRSGVAAPSPARPREVLLRWWLVPAALALAYVTGFLTSQGLQALRSATPPPVVADAPPPAAPVAGPREAASVAAPAAPLAHPADPVAPPALSGATDETAPVADRDASPLTPAAPEESTPALPAVSAPPPVGARTEEAPAPVGERAIGTPEAALAPAAVEEPPAEPTAPAPPQRAAAPRPVEVSVLAEPGAAILVDGQPVGSGTVSGLRLLPGPHRVEVRLADGRVVERVVEVKGTRYEVRVR